MAFHFSESHLEQYRKEGYTVFRKVTPPSLLRDLRRQQPRVRELIRKGKGLRLQPLAKADIDLKPFRDWMDLPELNDALHRTLSPRHRLGGGDLSRSGILIEPLDHPWCTQWHRDLHETTPGVDAVKFRKLNRDPYFFNQVNAPLLEDSAFWYVPASATRENLPGEKEAADRQLSWATEFPADTTDEERERHCLEYCGNMPGAIRVMMDAGDFCIYHPNGWHLGNYLHYKPRFTLHDWAPNPELLAFYDEMAANQMAAAKKPALAAA